MSALTWMSPASLPVPLLPHSLEALSAVETVTSPVFSAFSIAVALSASMVMSTGSISHSPPFVLICRFLSMLTVAADVSMNLACSVPAALVSPCCMSASSRIWPSFSCRVLAWIVPVLLTTLADRASAALPVMRTCPPSATMSCLFSIRVCRVAGSTCTFSRPLAPACRVIWSPAAIATVPSWARRMPSLLTVGASRAMLPPSLAVSSPWLVMLPVAPFLLKVCLPLRKSSLAMFMVVATKPPTSTLLPWPNTTPLGLISHTCPLALSWP